MTSAMYDTVKLTGSFIVSLIQFNQKLLISAAILMQKVGGPEILALVSLLQLNAARSREM